MASDQTQILEKLKKYPFLWEYTVLVHEANRPIIGRDEEMETILSTFQRPELSNVILLAEAGTGKTALVQGLKKKDHARTYLSVDLAKMIADVNDNNEMANRITELFAETMEFSGEHDRELVLFLDEFHQIVQLSPAAVEAMKPLLSDSGTRGIRVIAATTFGEFRQHIQSNQPLVERFTRVALSQPDRELTVSILRDMAKRYGVIDSFYNDYLFEMIYEYTNRYIPANSQPRKSILVLDAMVGWHRAYNRPLDKKLLAHVIRESEGVDVAFTVDARTIKEELDRHVLSQRFATATIEQRLHLCVAGLNDDTKPMSSFLFTGSTGVGKCLADYERVPALLDGKYTYKNHGDLVPGDIIFDRLGRPTKVEATFPHKDVKMYQFSFTDGRTLDACKDHLWQIYTAKQVSKMKKGIKVNPMVLSTNDILERGVVRTYPGDTREHLKFFIPMNHAVETPEKEYDIHPYAMGAFVADGSLRAGALTLSNDDPFVVNKVADVLGAKAVRGNPTNYDWYFLSQDDNKFKNTKYMRTNEMIGKYSEIYNVKSPERRIPREYLMGSIKQRMDLIHGLFDCDGLISSGDRLRVAYYTSSKGLAEDVRELLFSLGIPSSIKVIDRKDKGDGSIEYVVHVKSIDAEKHRFFTLPRQLEKIEKYRRHDKVREKSFEFVGIKSIEYIGKQNAQCILVDNEEHVYQAGDFVVTHNTEMTKQLARILFSDSRNLIRFDMSEYSTEDSLFRFTDTLTSRIWERPNSIILLDEIEKANAVITRVLLQVLDDGRLTNRDGRETSFINSYIILTTNAASEVYKIVAQYNVDDTGSGKGMEKYERLIRRSITQTAGDNKFPPELLGRIDTIVPFQPLSDETMKRITRKKLEDLAREVLEKHKVSLDIAMDDVIEYLVYDKLTTDSDSGGARAVVSKLETEVTTQVARYINVHPNRKDLIVEIQGEMAFQRKDMLESQAKVVVRSRRRRGLDGQYIDEDDEISEEDRRKEFVTRDVDYVLKRAKFDKKSRPKQSRQKINLR